MNISYFLMLLGGLALFLYGMQMMSSGLEAAAGNRMKTILEKLTSNRIKGVLVGAVITAVIQSSSATTVMVVGFVNSGLMTLNQAVWVIMGANIGTTVTGQLIALDISMIAPLIAFLGVSLIIFFKGEKSRHIGEIIAGLGVLFIGMEMMGSSMEPLRESQTFISFMTNFKNPLLGILVGAVFTAIIQSSSASIGILQALAYSNIIGLSSAVYVLFGQNIGTCITAVLASIGTKTNAKRTTLIHLMFNIIGTLIFTVICLTTPFVSLMESLTPGNPVAQIANTHTAFNIITTLLLLPFGPLMAKAATRILPGEELPEKESKKLFYLTTIDYRKGHQVGQISVSLSLLQKEVDRMLTLVRKNVMDGFDAVLNRSAKKIGEIEECEEYVDFLNAEISRYIAKLIVIEMSEQDSTNVNCYFAIVGNMERIADHAMNIAGYAKDIIDRNQNLSKYALEEIQSMKAVSLKTLDDIRYTADEASSSMLEQTAKNEQKIDDMNEQYRNNQISRMQAGACSSETSILYSEMLTDFERIGDHALNIAEEYHKMVL